MTSEGKVATVLPVIHSDNDTVFTSGEFEGLCHKAGFTQTFSTPGCPQQNGTAERAQRTIVEPATAMLIRAGKPSKYWTYAFSFAVFLQNHLPRESSIGKTAGSVLGSQTTLALRI